MMSSLHANLSPEAPQSATFLAASQGDAHPHTVQKMQAKRCFLMWRGEAPHWTISVCACGKGAGELGLVHDAPSFKTTRQTRLVRCTKSLRASVRFSAQPSSTNGN